MTHFLLSLFLTPTLTFAHGEEKPGPHGGHIQMPGAFHTELVLDKDQSAHIYLLDMNFTNPSIKDSSVEVTAKTKGKSVAFQCMIMNENHFHCTPEKKYPATAKIIVKAVREKAPGNEAVYKLPLVEFKNSTPQKSESQHNHH